MRRSTRLLAGACALVWSAGALAQTAAVTDPLNPRPQTDSRNPPRFQQFERPALAQLGPATDNFSAPAAGAGDTGFDSTNARKKSKRKANIAPGPAAPLVIAPYQKAAANTANRSLAQVPGAPPVELGPIRQPPKKRKAHTEPEDPYAPLGVHAGSFLLYPAIELIGGYDTNPAHVAGGGAAKLYTIAPELRAQSNWSRHEVKAELRGSYTGYSPDTTPTLSRPNFNGKVDGRIDVTHDTRIDLGSRVTVATDNPGSPNLQAGLAHLPIFTTVGSTAGIGQRFNRLDISLKGDVERTVYQDSTLTDGTTASNKDRQYNQYAAKLRTNYEWSPGFKPFVEVDADTRVHDVNADNSGFQRNSKGLTGLVGGIFEFTRLLTGEIGVGYTRRTYEDPRLEQVKGLIGEASLIWTANALTTVKLSGNSAVGESTVPGVSGVLYRDVSLQVDHAFRRWLIGTVKVGAGFDNYVGLDRQDKRYSAGLGLTYKLDRMIQIKGEFRQDWLRSNVTGVDYTASVFLIGLRLQR
jgi:hypothetical protein